MTRSLISLLCLLCCLITNSLSLWGQELSTDSSSQVSYFWKVHPFSDSMRTDSTRKMLREQFSPKFNKQPLPLTRESLSPFVNMVYKKNVRNRNWFFYTSILIILLIIANRSFYSAMFYARYQSLFSRSRFNDLLENMKTNVGPSSILSIITAQAVYTQIIIICLITFGYSRLANNPLFFLVLMSALLLWRAILFLTQSLHCMILELTPMHRIITLFKTNFELFTGIVLLPLCLAAYYNLDTQIHDWAAPVLLYLLLSLLLMRILISVFMQIRYGYLNFFGLLYFCALEILPYLLLFTLIRQTLT